MNSIVFVLRVKRVKVSDLSPKCNGLKKLDRKNEKKTI